MGMKRRNRKRSSKAARPAKIPVDAEKAAGPSVTLAGADYVTDLGDEFIAAVEADGPTSNSSAPAGADEQTHPGDEFTATVEEEKAAGRPPAPAGADRRIHPRYEFIAAVEVVAAESGARMETRIRDLSQQGCYVDTNNALPLGTVTDVRITKGAQRFEARAHAGHQCSRCVDSAVGTGIQRTTAHSVERPDKSGAGMLLSRTLTGIKGISLRWEWSSCYPILCSGMWPSRQEIGRPVTQMRNPA